MASSTKKPLFWSKDKVIAELKILFPYGEGFRMRPQKSPSFGRIGEVKIAA